MPKKTEDFDMAIAEDRLKNTRNVIQQIIPAPANMKARFKTGERTVISLALCQKEYTPKEGKTIIYPENEVIGMVIWINEIILVEEMDGFVNYILV